jgi:hypothetical protein
VNDLERDLRDLLRDDAHRVPAPTEAPRGLRRAARWRQTGFVAFVCGSALALVAAIVAGASPVLPVDEEQVPADQPTTVRTLNGISITIPEGWVLVDPDEAGLNGPDPTTVQLPRSILALAPSDPGDAWGCPGQAPGEVPTFLLTVQEEPLALDGPSSAPWPVSLEPMDIGDSESPCYPGWEFSRAGWTVAGRTFEARVGLASALTDEDRVALFAAFDSMTFEGANGEATSAVLATGTAGTDDWQLIATKQVDGLSLTLQGESFGTGTGGYDATAHELRLTSHVFGEGAGSQRVVFAAVPADVVRLVASGPGFIGYPEVLDVPDEIDPRLNAFVIVVDADTEVAFEGFTAADELAISGGLDAEGKPLGTAPGGSAALLEDGRHFGFVRSVDVAGRTLGFDLAYFLSGEEANQAYQEATGEGGPVPNDHWIVNDKPKLRTLTLAPDLRLRLLDWDRCCDSFFDGDLALFAQAIQTQGDVTDADGHRYSGVSQWWITIRDGVVTEIEEQYSP